MPEKVLKPAKQDSKVEKWTRWIEGEIKGEVLTMHHHQAVYRRVAEIVNAREPKLPGSLFFDYFRDTYATSQSAAVRRQAEPSPRVVSLRRLLDEIAAEPERLSRQRFVGAWPPEDQRRGNETFLERFAGDVGDHLDPKPVVADIERLVSESKIVTDHVDQYIAHTDEKPVAQLATFEELNAAIRVVGELFRKYALLLTGDSYATLVPVPQHNWEAIFEMPWIVKAT
jgi:hypothetical protein